MNQTPEPTGGNSVHRERTDEEAWIEADRLMTEFLKTPRADFAEEDPEENGLVIQQRYFRVLHHKNQRG